MENSLYSPDSRNEVVALSLLESDLSADDVCTHIPLSVYSFHDAKVNDAYWDVDQLGVCAYPDMKDKG